MAYIIIVPITGIMKLNVAQEVMIVSLKSFFIGKLFHDLSFMLLFFLLSCDIFFIATPISSGVCEYQFGLYEDSPSCSTSYIKCEFGVPHQLPCDKGLVYDQRIHGCNWPDLLLEKCNPEAVVGFKCPAKVDGPAARFWPFPRFPGKIFLKLIYGGKF